MTPGALIRSVRRRCGLSQSQLARRTGTRQSAISRLERDELSPSVATLRLLLRAMGEELELSSRPMERRHDPKHHTDWLSRSPEERLRLAISWNRLAGRLRDAGASAKVRSGDG